MKDKRGKNEEGGKSMDRGESDREEEVSAKKLKKKKKGYIKTETRGRNKSTKVGRKTLMSVVANKQKRSEVVV